MIWRLKYDSFQPTNLACHQVSIINEKGLIHSLGTFRHGKYLQYALSDDIGRTWRTRQISIFEDPAIHYVNILRVDSEYHIYYAAYEDGEWSIRLSTCKRLSGPYKLFGSVLFPSIPEDINCVGGCSTILEEGRILMWYTAVDDQGVYNIQSASSEDGVNWEKTGTAYRYDFLDSKGCSNPSVIKYKSRYHMFFSKNNLLHGNGYWGIGHCHSMNPTGFSEDNHPEMNVVSQPLISKYPSVSLLENELRMWGNQAESYPPKVCVATLKPFQLDKSNQLVIQAGEKRQLQISSEFEIVFDRNELEFNLNFSSGSDRIEFINGHMFVVSKSKITHSMTFDCFQPIKFMVVELGNAYQLQCDGNVIIETPNKEVLFSSEYISSPYPKRNGYATLSFS